jgi:glycosyltransferase involved in cell wall biosynthesis
VRISLIIAVCPAHHRAAVLGQCLAAVARQTVSRADLEVILVGDGVRLDPSLAPSDLPVGCQSLATRVGVSAARNHGLRVATGEGVAFLDGDCVPRPDWLERLRATLLREGAAGCGGRTVQSRDRREHDNRLSSARTVLPCAGLGNVLFRAEVLAEIGGFDESMCFGAEEADLCWRVCLKGHRIVYAPDAIVEHQTHKSARKLRFYGQALRQLERKFGAVLTISKRAELRRIAASYRRAHAGEHGFTLAQRVRLLAVLWGYGGGLLAEVTGRVPSSPAADLSDRTLQAQRTIAPLAVQIDGRRLTRPNHVLWWTSESGCCVLNLATRTRFALDGLAADVWIGAMRGASLDDLRRRLVAAYDVVPEVLSADVDEFLHALLHDGLLREVAAA